MKTLFVGGHHDGERLNVMQDGHVEALLSIPPDFYTLRHIQGNHLFYAPSSWSDDDAVLHLLLGYHSPFLNN